MITVEHLTKRYGNFTAVDDLSFEIEEGHVYGFLGPNGAGKSTTMNIMTGCLSATAGHVTIDGYDIFEEPDRAKRLMGYLPEQPPLYLNETPVEYLKFVGEAKGLRGRELAAQIEAVISQTKLEAMKNRLISKLSKGYKQRVGIAQALLGNPKVIILDEPTVGLDPIQIIEIRDLIRQLGQEHTVILSSHILSEVQTICEKVLIIAKGKLVAFDEPENLDAFRTPFVLLPDLKSNKITDPLIEERYFAIMPVAQGLLVKDGEHVTELLTTSDIAYSKAAGYELDSYEKEEGDTDGPFALAVSAEAENGGQIIWFASSHFLDEMYNAYSSGANLDLAMNAMSSVIGENEAVAIRSKSLNYHYLTISDSTASFLKLIMIGVFPLVYLGIGICVTIGRRKRNEAK